LHIVTHALFKSTLFLRRGSLIYLIRGGQDSRIYGNFGFNRRRLNYFFVSCLCLCGFPFLIGFYSKDAIILGSGYKGGLLYIFFLLCCVLTVCYSLRLINLGFISAYKSTRCVSLLEKALFCFPVFFLFKLC
jgi:NADH:ubiquinone oxidoreductase subunit 5 (subunit L)/multisubunit Na+/H+ antiporter MnhA subunit